VILGVRGSDHPLMAYWGARVPVVLSTDDMGVSRIDLSNEYLRAARDYPFGYRELKRIARNSLEHSFLDAAEKDAQVRNFEQASAEFERAVVNERGLLRNIGTLIAGLFRWP
jgi:adenosine deaminase